nr:hypothetical protein [Tanacetum cinerariifolium]
MSMMGVLTYFFRFQIKQSERGISINQEKYVKDLLKKYDINGSSVKTPMVPPNKLGHDLNGKAVNKTQPDIQFSTYLCARYQANPKESHIIAVTRIFRYLKGTLSLGLWYPKCSGMSSAEAKYVAAAGCCANIVWMKVNSLTMTSYMKRDHILKWDIELHFIPTQYQLADIFTKPLDEPTFKRLIVKLEHMMPEYENKELTIKLTHVFSVYNLALNPNQPEEPPFTDHMKAICKLDVPVDSKAPKSSSQTREVP